MSHAVSKIAAPSSGKRDVEPARTEITYFYGIRGVSSLYIVLFHLNYIILEAHAGPVPALYSRLTDWIRVGDFRISAFFVISGYLLTLPTVRSAGWKLSSGVGGFLTRRVERLLLPYYVALMFSVILFAIWKHVVGAALNIPALVAGTLAHVLLLHNLDPRTSLYINDTLWNVALEFQCYVLFALVFLPVMRRYGPWAQLALGAVVGLAPHFLFHGWLDWTRPWFITLYTMGVTAAALGNRAYPRLVEFRRRVPWGSVWAVMSVASVWAIARSGFDTPYGDGLLQNMLLGVSISSFIVFVAMGYTGWPSSAGRALVHAFENRLLCTLGRFSYSTYLIQYPILRLAVALTAVSTHSFWLVAILGFAVYLPMTIGLAYLFHICFERPLQTRRVFSRKVKAATG